MPHSTTYWLDCRLSEAELRMIYDMLEVCDPDEPEPVDPQALIAKLKAHARPIGEYVGAPLPQRNEPLEDLPF